MLVLTVAAGGGAKPGPSTGGCDCSVAAVVMATGIAGGRAGSGSGGSDTGAVPGEG